MSRIADIRGREIIDSRGNPTVEAEVTLKSGVTGRAAVAPSDPVVDQYRRKLSMALN